MSTFVETLQETFHIVSCYSCSLRFGITHNLFRRAVRDATGTVYCPVCGRGTCWGESEDQKRIKQARQQQLRKNTEQSLQAIKGVVTRPQKRIAAGVCPCCHRTVKQLSRHMAQQHPGYEQQGTK